MSKETSLMPSTFAHALFPSAAAFVARKAFPTLTKKQVVKLMFVAMFLGNSPDLDLIPASIWVDYFHPIHRNVGHNMFSLMFLIWMGTKLLRRFVSADISTRQAWFVSSGLVLSHILLDSMGDYNMFGERPSIPIFFPFSQWSFYLPFKLFPCAALHQGEGVHPFMRHVLSAEFWERVFLYEIFYTGVLVSIWASLFFGARWAGRAVNRACKNEKGVPNSGTPPLKQAS